MTKEEYLKLKNKLQSLHRRQYEKKRQFRMASKGMSDLEKSLNAHAIIHDNRRFASVKVMEAIFHGRYVISKITKELQSGAEKIKSLEMVLREERFKFDLQKAIYKALSKQKPVTYRDIATKILSMRGLFLHDNNEVSTSDGKLWGYYGDDASYNGNDVKFTLRPLEFNVFSIVIDGITSSDCEKITTN